MGAPFILDASPLTWGYFLYRPLPPFGHPPLTWGRVIREDKDIKVVKVVKIIKALKLL